MSNLKYSQVLDYILILLSDIKRSAPTSFLSLPAVLNILEYKVSFSEVVDIAEYLETKGYINVVNNIGDILIQITTSGLLFVEEFNQTTLNNYSLFLEEKMLQGKISLQLFKSRKKPKTKVLELINDIKKNIISQEGNKSDFVKDIDVIRIEMSKKIPDLRIVDIKIDEFNHLSYISEKIRELRNYVVHAM